MTDPAADAETFLAGAADSLFQEAQRYRRDPHDESDLELLHNQIVAAALRADLGLQEPEQKAWLKRTVGLCLVTYIRIANSLTSRPADRAYPATIPDLVTHIRDLMAAKGSKYRQEPVAFLPSDT